MKRNGKTEVVREPYLPDWFGGQNRLEKYRYIDSSTKQEHDRREEWIDDQVCICQSIADSPMTQQ